MEKSNSMNEVSVKTIARDYFASIHRLADQVDLTILDRIVHLLKKAHQRGSMVYVMGNGGSAANASHFANDLGKSTKRDHLPSIRVLSLTDNTPWLTALANDEGYDNVFAGQLENYVQKEDVVIAISVSGNSPNILRAVELANEKGAVTIGLTGFDGGKLKDSVDESLHVSSPKGVYTLVEDVHMMILNIITTCFNQD